MWPSSDTEEKVHRQQERQKGHHTSNPRKVLLEVNSPVMARNYARGDKWLPGKVERKTGPVSFRVRLVVGNLIKRHQYQLHMRQSSLPQVSHPDEAPVVLDALSSSSVRLPEPLESPVQSEFSRRSSRQRKPTTRLDL